MATPAAAAGTTVDDDGDSVLQDEEDVTPVTVTNTSLMTMPVTGPVCNYGPRLAYTYFTTTSTTTTTTAGTATRHASPPNAEQLNQSQDEIHFFTVDDQLVYLSFYQDSGPLNAACL